MIKLFLGLLSSAQGKLLLNHLRQQCTLLTRRPLQCLAWIPAFKGMAHLCSPCTTCSWAQPCTAENRGREGEGGRKSCPLPIRVMSCLFPLSDHPFGTRLMAFFFLVQVTVWYHLQNPNVWKHLLASDSDSQFWTLNLQGLLLGSSKFSLKRAGRFVSNEGVSVHFKLIWYPMSTIGQ